MPYSDPAARRATSRGSMQRLRARRGGTTGLTMLSDFDSAAVATVAGCQALFAEAVEAARDPSLDAATRSRLLVGIAAAGSRIVADGALEKRMAEIERVMGTAA